MSTLFGVGRRLKTGELGAR